MATSCGYSTSSIAGIAASSADAPARKTVLMISYFFPPVGGVALAATQRVVKFLVGMQGSEWRPIVLTLRENDYEPYFEKETAYLEKIPQNVAVIRTGRFRTFERILLWRGRLRARLKTGAAPHDPKGTIAAVPSEAGSGRRSIFQRFKDGLTGMLEVPDPQIVWLPYACAAGFRLIRRQKIDCIYATGSPWSGMLLARLLHGFTRIPLVLDFRDPWVTNPYRMHFHPLRRRFEAALEGIVVRRADAVIANTPELMEEFARRYPKLGRKRLHALYNSIEDSETVDATPACGTGAAPANDRGSIRIVHAGFLYGVRDPRVFLTALSRVLEKHPRWREKVVLELAGTVQLDYSLDGLLEELRLQAATRVYGHLPHAQCRRLLAEASVLLLLQPGTKTQIPSKLFEYLPLNKPILALAAPGSATFNFIVNEQAGWAAACGDPNEIELALQRCIRAVELQVGCNDARRLLLLEKYSVPAVTRRLLDILTQSASHAPKTHEAPVQESL
jgi:glycosyltransferase involved in cell wall biosynthesis